MKAIQYSNFGSMIDAIKRQEYQEVKSAVEAHGGQYCWDVNASNYPIIAVNVNGYCPQPMDVCIKKVAIIDNRLELEGVDNEYGNPVKFSPSDVFAGHLSFIMDYLPATETITSVAQTYPSNVLFGKAAARAYNLNEWEDFVASGEGYGHITREFNSEAERQAYYLGMIDNDGWEEYTILEPEELLDDDNLEVL